MLVAGWPLHYWYAGQGAILIFIAVIAYYAWRRNRSDGLGEMALAATGPRYHVAYLHRRLLIYVVFLLAFLFMMGVAERAGLPRAWIGAIFLFSTLTLYAAIGIYCRTTDPLEYYLAGRRVPAIYNGMATAADWMSAASFISLAGGLYLQGFSGTAAQPGGWRTCSVGRVDSVSWLC